MCIANIEIMVWLHPLTDEKRLSVFFEKLFTCWKVNCAWQSRQVLHRFTRKKKERKKERKKWRRGWILQEIMVIIYTPSACRLNLPQKNLFKERFWAQTAWEAGIAWRDGHVTSKAVTWRLCPGAARKCSLQHLLHELQFAGANCKRYAQFHKAQARPNFLQTS